MGGFNGSMLMGLEHPATVTIGRRGSAEQDLKPGWEQHGLSVHAIDRGGQATIHSPGQLVIYPLVDLTEIGLRPRAFVELISATTIKVLSALGLSAWSDTERPGIYTANGKIAFFGLRVSHGGRVTHGLSLSVSNDLSLFNQIRPCGCEAGTMTSLKNEGREISTEALFFKWTAAFREGLFLTRPPRDPNLAEVNLRV